MNAMPAVANPTHEVDVESTVLGSLRVPEDQVYAFEHGILGLPEARTFALLPAERDGFFWLQSLESEALTFLLIDPFRFVEDYSVELSPQEVGELTPSEPADILVLSILTLPKTPEDPATANLQGPLALNVREGKGKQVVLQTPYGLRVPVELGGR